jgi:hypothetical protein
MMSTPVDLRSVQLLKWPTDASIIAQLDLIEMQCWYCAQDPRSMIWLGQNKEFKRFWFRHYLLPLRIKRVVYKLKHLFMTGVYR